MKTPYAKSKKNKGDQYIKTQTQRMQVNVEL